ncbi:MAG: molybdenum cofactor guanylyltransferase [Halococcoides sp.]
MTDDRGRRAGVVLAGGQSTRFEGAEKALATLNGRPLLDHAVEGVATATDLVVVSCRTDQVTAFRHLLAERSDVVIVPDRVPDRGPVAGLVAALDALDASSVAVVACDHPLVDGAFLEWLFDALGDHDACVPRLDGHRQPTHAVYRTTPARQVARAVGATGGLQTVLDRLDCRVVPEESVLARTDRATFTDVDTRDRLAALDGPEIHTG